MKRLLTPFFFLVVLLTLPSSLLPQQECEKRLLPTFVTNKDGDMLTNLSPADFKLESHGLPMSVVEWTPDERRHRVVILLDISGSMHGLPGSGLWNVVMALTRHVANIDSDNSEFALILFTDRVVETVEFSRGRDALRQRLNEISRDPHFPIIGKGNDTKIYDTVKEGIRLIENPTSADSMLVITDGFDQASETKPNQVLALLSNTMVRVFSIVVDPLPHTSGQRTGIEQSEFIEFVQKSGGKAFGPVDAENAAFGRSAKSLEAQKFMLQRLAQFYAGMLHNGVLTIQMPSSVQRTEAVSLSLSDSARQRSKKAQVFFPHEIGPCLVAAPRHAGSN